MTAPLKVSVCVLNHNYGRWVGEAVDSVLAQTYPHVEVVVVDDGSTDESRPLLRAYGDRIRLVEQAQGGQRGAANGALEVATGDIVQFLDADDRLHRDAVAKVVEAFTTVTPRPVLVQYRLRTVDADGNPLGRLRPPRPGLLASGDLRRTAVRYRTWHSQLTSGCSFWAADLRRATPVPVLEDEYHALDHYLISVVPFLGTVHSLEYVGVDYRVHDTSDSHHMPDEVAWPRRRIALTRREHETTFKVVTQLGADYPWDPEAPLDVAYTGWRLWSLRADPATHPVPGDRRARLAARGVHAALRQPGLPLRHRVKRVVWFGAMAIAPARAVGWILDWYRPDGPRLRRGELVG